MSKKDNLIHVLKKKLIAGWLGDKANNSQHNRSQELAAPDQDN